MSGTETRRLIAAVQAYLRDLRDRRQRRADRRRADRRRARAGAAWVLPVDRRISERRRGERRRRAR